MEHEHKTNPWWTRFRPRTGLRLKHTLDGPPPRPPAPPVEEVACTYFAGTEGDISVLAQARRPAWTPERRLAAAMIEQAQVDLGTATGPIRDHARRWVAGEPGSWPFSFESLCEALRLSPSAVRARLLAVPAGEAPVRETSLRARLLVLLSAGPRTTAEMAAELGCSVQAAASAAQDMAKAGRAVRIGRRRYAVAGWTDRQREVG